MCSIRRFLAALALACCCFSVRAHAQEQPANATPTRQQCVDAHEQAQSARLSGQPLLARNLLRQCSAAACPALVSRDCTGWLAEVERQIPSVIFRATRDGKDVIQLAIREGERVLADSITGTALELEPGPHQFACELPGFPAQHATYVLQAGDKGRVVHFDFLSPTASAAPAPPPPTATTTRRTDRVVFERPIPTISYVLGATALVAGVTGGALGGLALSERADLNHQCAPLCGQAEVQKVQRLALAADVSFLVAIVSGALAGYSYATRPSVSADRAQAARPRSLQLAVGQKQLRLAVEGSF